MKATAGKATLPSLGRLRRWPHLVIRGGEGAGEIFRLRAPETIVGREATADIRFDDETVSRQHAVFMVTDGKVILQDLGSLNGTFIGERPVLHATALEDRDLVMIGDSIVLELVYSVAFVDASSLASPGSTPRASRASNAEFVQVLRTKYATAASRDQPLVFGFFRVEGVAGLLASGNSAVLAERLMSRATAVVVGNIRGTDLMTRTRDDELLVVLDSDTDAAVTVAERLRARMAEESTLIGPVGLPRRVSGVLVPVSSDLILAPETILGIVGEKARKTLRPPPGRITRVPMLICPGPGATRMASRL